MNRFALILSLAVASLSAMPAALKAADKLPQPICIPTDGDRCIANRRCYGPIVYPAGTGICPDENLEVVYMPNARPPAPAALNCEAGGGTFNCDAWPQGEGLTYSWQITFGTGAMHFPYPNDPNDPYSMPSCLNPGTVQLTVTVRSPAGLTATATRELYCGY